MVTTIIKENETVNQAALVNKKTSDLNKKEKNNIQSHTNATLTNLFVDKKTTKNTTGKATKTCATPSTTKPKTGNTSNIKDVFVRLEEEGNKNKKHELPKQLNATNTPAESNLVIESSPSVPVIKLRQKNLKPSVKPKPVMQLLETEEYQKNETSNGNGFHASINETEALLHRTMESLYESPPDLEDNTEEIRKLDSQLDHLSEYMDKVEERIKAHNDRLMETIKQQKEEREKRRRSFHERLDLNRQEDDDFQRQLTHILNRVDISMKRRSMPPAEVKVASETVANN